MTVTFSVEGRTLVYAEVWVGTHVYHFDTGLTLTDLCLSDELNVAALHRAVRKHLPALRALAAASGELPE